MICSKCGLQNNAADKFCHSCGASLSAYDQSSAEGSKGGSAEAEDLSFFARTLLAIRDAKHTDARHLRPLTRMAYLMEESNNSGTLRFAVNLLFYLLCVGIIADLLAIFDRFSRLSLAMTSTGSAGKLSEIYQGTGADSAGRLFWLVVLLLGLIYGFVLVGKLLLRSKKVRRKKRRDEVDRLL